MEKHITVGSLVLVTCLGLGCGEDALKSGTRADSAAGGQSGALAGAPGGGGAGAGGFVSGAGGGAGAGPGNSGGVGAGGASGGTGGLNTGGAAGTGGTVCPPVGACTDVYCPYGYLPNPSDPCGCPVCAPSPDAGPGRDTGMDACLALPCFYPSCPAGYTVVTLPCGCPTCVPGDAGPTDAVVCPPTCPAARCAYGTVPDPLCGCPICIEPDAGSGKDGSADACVPPLCDAISCPVGYVVTPHACSCPTCEAVDAGQPEVGVCRPIECADLACPTRLVPNPADPCACPICAPTDAGPDTRAVGCAGFDECTCVAANGCAVITNTCYCPYDRCLQGGACGCGGGKFLGCAPVQLVTCAAAKARVAGLCPDLSGATFDGLCQQSDAACITKCLNDVTSCGDVRCSFCEVCDCAGDAFATCRSKCRSALAQ